MKDFEELLSAFKPSVERWVRYHVGNPSDAEDLLQEICLAAYRAFSTLKNTDAFRPWIISIARHKWQDWLRKQSASMETPMAAVPEPMDGGEEDSAVQETLDRLSERDRLMLRLAYQESFPQKEIARLLSIPVGTVKSRLYHARDRFREAYPYEMRGGKSMKDMLPDRLPDYTITWKNEPPFSVEWEELMGWFIVPREGERLRWGMYDLPSRRLDVSYNIEVTGKASVHGVPGVEITARAILPGIALAEDDPMREPVRDSGAPQEEWRFVAQLSDGYTRFLSAERMENGVRTLTTFLDGEEFMANWGFGEDNCGNAIHLTPKGVVRREGTVITSLNPRAAIDVVGRCDVRMNGKVYDTICVMDLGVYNDCCISEQYLDRHGHTVLWRRFNRDDWALERYGKTWSEQLPDNERLTLDGKAYVHWYDCLPIRLTEENREH